MTLWDEIRLNQEGVSSLAELGAAEVERLVLDTQYRGAVLATWVDGALLRIHAGEEMVNRLARVNIRTATQLVYACYGKVAETDLQTTAEKAARDEGAPARDALRLYVSRLCDTLQLAKTLVNYRAGAEAKPQEALGAEAEQALRQVLNQLVAAVLAEPNFLYLFTFGMRTSRDQPAYAEERNLGYSWTPNV